MYYGGIDPDLKNVPMAFVDDRENVVFWKVIKPTGTGAAAAASAMVEMLDEPWLAGHQKTIAGIAVESQTVYRTHAGSKGTNPNSLIAIANVSGAAVLAATALGLDSQLVLPKDWTTVPKQVNQMRICKRMGWAYTKVGTVKAGYTHPTNLSVLGPKLGKTQWKHLMDAIGLALWMKDNS